MATSAEHLRKGDPQMQEATNIELFVDMLAAVRDRDENAIIGVLDRATGLSRNHLDALLRIAIHYDSPSSKYIRRVINAWKDAGSRGLKLTSLKISVELLSDGTVDGMLEPLALFLAALGIDATVIKGEYDSLEFEAYAGEPSGADVTFVLVSERWARRRVAHPSPLISDAKMAIDSWAAILSGLAAKRQRVVVSEFIKSAWPVPSATNPGDGRLPWSAFVERLNSVAVSDEAPSNVYSVSAETSQFISGGSASAGRNSLVRMRAPLEIDGLIGLAREMASGLAHLLGRGHRALLLDWDNTLWGGEVGELGFSGIEVGPETPDGFAYQILQGYILDLNLGGTLLAAISRNDPAVSKVLEANEHILLRRSNFASLQLNWGDKSNSASRIVEELNFSPEFMVYVDDNHVDLAQVLDHFPSMDVLLAGPEPDQTLDRLVKGRFFNAFQMTQEDFLRSDQSSILREQREILTQSTSKEDFLSSLDININVDDVSTSNRDRVLQLLQKTNQFNVTTKRHDINDLAQLSNDGAQFGVFSYSDRFGSQGIIGLVILVPSRNDAWEIDTWLMSCRVLNRGVEEAMLEWMKSKLQSGELYGTYLPTAKNGLVADLFNRFGFARVDESALRYKLHVA